MAFLTGLTDAILSYYCVSTQLTENIYDMFRPLLFNASPLAQFGLDAAIDWVTFPRAAICNDLPDYDSSLAVPFNGGQCPGIRYTVNVTWRQTYNGGFVWNGSTLAGTYYGKVSAVEVLPLEIGQFPILQVTSQGKPPSPYTPNSASDDFVQLGITGMQPGETFELLTVTVAREDGQPDICGNPPPTVPPPTNNYNVHNVNVTFNNNDGNQLSIPVTLIYGQAFIDANLNVTVPVTVELKPTVSIKANINIGTGDVKFDIAPTFVNNGGNISIDAGSDTRNTFNTNNYNVKDPLPVPPPGSESEDVPPPPVPEQERIIRAVIVTTTVVNEAKVGTLYQEGENPDIYIPNLGYVQFAIRIGGSISWTRDISVKSLRMFIPCEWEGGAVDVQGTPAPGCSFILTPVYGVTD